MYASFLGILGALHLSIFQQPVQQVFFRPLFVLDTKEMVALRAEPEIVGACPPEFLTG